VIITIDDEKKIFIYSCIPVGSLIC
jgi:hypothetical protein